MNLSFLFIKRIEVVFGAVLVAFLLEIITELIKGNFVEAIIFFISFMFCGRECQKLINYKKLCIVEIAPIILQAETHDLSKLKIPEQLLDRTIDFFIRLCVIFSGTIFVMNLYIHAPWTRAAIVIGIIWLIMLLIFLTISRFSRLKN